MVKTTHLSGWVLFHTDPDESVDRDLLHKWLNTKYYRIAREENYRHIQPKVIVEEFFSEDGLSMPKNYKLFCFHGVPKLIQVDSDRSGEHMRNFYDMRWNRLPMTCRYPAGPEDGKRPLLEEISEIASLVASAFSLVCVDLYASQTRVCVGELAFCPEGANAPFLPDAADIELARLFGPDYYLGTKACAEAWTAG